MTPERRKYLENITEREKALRDEIGRHEYYIADFKYQLSRMRSWTGRKILKQRIKAQKYILCALKHELERIQPTTDIEFIVQRGYICAYECCNCHKEFAAWDEDDMPKYCPHCHRKIERDC